MKKFLFILVLAVLIFPMVSYAYYDLGVNYSLKENYLQGEKLGASSALSDYLVMWEKGQPVIYISYSISENSEESKNNLSLIKNRFDFGASMTLAENLKFKFAGSNLLEENTDKFSAYGMYLIWRPNQFLKKMELGAEMDTELKTFYFAASRFNFFHKDDFDYNWLLGFSSENTSDSVSQRFGFGSNMGLGGYSAVIALTQNLDDGGQTRLYGLAKNNSFIAVFRDKPESDYWLGILTLKGQALNLRANQEIFDAFFAGSLSGTRVVANRNFDKIGLSPAYQIQDYGKLVLSVSVSKIDIDGANLLNDAQEIDWTLGDAWKIKSFYLSGGRVGETNLFYNSLKMGLAEDYQTSLSLGFGGKVSMFDVPTRFSITNFYSLNQSNWAGVSTQLIFSF
ncbi:MAG: hypothetical protein HYV52_02670 [Parcubacteria group bacterium]|nr:hypothetical protein [Parcubacteria group bacterium]